VQDVQISTQLSRSQYQYTLTGTDAKEVSLWARKLVAEMRRDPMFRDVSSEAQEGGLRASLDINRQRAGQLGVNLQAVNDTLNERRFTDRPINTASCWKPCRCTSAIPRSSTSSICRG